MLRRVRHELRMIRYYSASRPRTAWTVARDVALFAALVLAVPVAWLFTLVVRDAATVHSLAGILNELPDGSLVAAMDDPRGFVPPIGGKFIGRFALSEEEHREGWPIATMVDRKPILVALDLAREPQARPAATLAPDDPFRIAIESALLAADPDLHPAARELHESWQAGAPAPRHHMLGWTASAAIWWVLLSFSFVAVLEVLGFFWKLGRSRRASIQADRRARGRCVGCGYDMTGLEFNERCPECGTIV